MRRTTMIGAAVIAVLSFTALAGTTSAFANETTLCKAEQSYCPESSRYASGTALKAVSTNVQLSDPYGNILSCESVLEGKTTAASGQPLSAEFPTWTLENCKAGWENNESCTTSAAQHLPASAAISVGTPPNGTAALTGSGGEVGWKVTCESAGVEGTFSFNPTLAFEGGNPGHLAATKQAMKCKGFCLLSPTFTASYTITSPQPVYVSRTNPETVLCKVSDPCPKASVYPSGTKFEAVLAKGTKAEIRSNHTISCTSGTISGETSAESSEKGLPAKIWVFSLTGCTWLEGQPCQNESQALPWSTTFTRNAETLKSYMEVGGFNWRWLCEATGVDCKFSAPTLKFEMTGGSPATLNVSQSLSREGIACPTSATFVAKYEISSPSPLYVARY